MTLPSFIGIGAERSGSTWLYKLLQQHPQVYMPENRKEIHFFDKNYHKEFQWYESFFPDEQIAKNYKAIGEFTPAYLNCTQCAERISALNSVQKLIVILRNPVNRAYSAYGHFIRMANYQKSFEEYINEFPKSIEQGLYGEQLDDYLKYYDRKDICCLIFENAVNDIDSTKRKLANFLEIELDQFPESSGLEKVNQTYLPRFKKLNEISCYVRNKLVNKDLFWLVNTIKILGFQKILEYGKKSNSLQPMSLETKHNLRKFFEQDIKKIESSMNINLDIWRV